MDYWLFSNYKSIYNQYWVAHGGLCRQHTRFGSGLSLVPPVVWAWLCLSVCGGFVVLWGSHDELRVPIRPHRATLHTHHNLPPTHTHTHTHTHYRMNFKFEPKPNSQVLLLWLTKHTVADSDGKTMPLNDYHRVFQRISRYFLVQFSVSVVYFLFYYFKYFSNS